MNIEKELSVKGRFKPVVLNSDGTIKTEGEWQKNIVLDNFFDRLNSQSFVFNAISVGTGNSAPSVSQTKLDNWIAATNTNSITSSNPDPYSLWTGSYQFDFNQGAVVGNIAELGLTFSTATNSDVVTRALFVDGVGQPTTISVNSDELLRIFYELEIAFDPGIQTNIITIDGISTTVSGYLCGRSSMDFRTGGIAGSARYEVFSDGVDISTILDELKILTTTNPSFIASSVLFSAENMSLSGNLTQNVIDGYIFTISAGVSAGNFALGISHLYVANRIRYMLQFDPPIPKTDQDILEFDFRFKWIRGA